MYQKEKLRWMKHLDFIILDIILLQLALVFAYWYRQGWGKVGSDYAKLSVFLLFVSFAAGFFSETYEGVLRRGYLIEMKKTIIYVTLVSASMIIVFFVLKTSASYSRAIILLGWALGIIFCYVGRCFLKMNLLKRKKRGIKRALLIVTTEQNTVSCIEKLKEFEYSGLQPVGISIIGSYSGVKSIAGIPVIGRETDVFEYFRTHVLDEIFIDKAGCEKIKVPVEKYIEAGLTVHTKLAEVEEFDWENQVENFAGNVVLTNTFKIATPRQLFMKRCFDICGGIVGVICTALITVFVAPVIYIQSPGPIFFSQWRVGRNGRKFKIYKFRSMYTDAEERKKELMDQNEMSGFMFKMENDPRIFPFGHFLRNTSLDEFPQFWNVLKGDMSLVGTRPPTVDEVEQYEFYHRKRISIKPGLTGMWQVSGRSEITDFEEVVKLDAKYISKWRLSLDIKILWKTVEVVLLQKGSK